MPDTSWARGRIGALFPGESKHVKQAGSDSDIDEANTDSPKGLRLPT